MATYLILPGGWAGGWQSPQIVKLLEQAGRTVCLPTCTYPNCSTRPNDRETVLNTQVQDVLRPIERDDVREIILVGFDLSGDIAARVAESVPERIRHFVYVDARLPENAPLISNISGSHVRAPAEEAGLACVDAVRLPHDAPNTTGLADLPVETAERVVMIRVATPAWPCTYIRCTAGSGFAAFTAPAAYKARAAGWAYREIPRDGASRVALPEELAAELLEIA